MGKIFDALSKSEKEHIKLSSKNEENTALNELPPKIAEPLNISGSLYNIDRNLVALTDPGSFEAEQFKLLDEAATRQASSRLHK